MASLLATNDFPPKVGGIQAYLWELWRRLPPEATTVFTTPYAGDRAFDAACAFRIERTSAPVLLPIASVARRVDALAAETDADVVFLDPMLPLGVVGHRLASAPHVIVVHGAEITVPGRLPGTHTLARRVLRDAAGIVAAGRYPAVEACRAAGLALPTLVVPPGVDAERFRPVADDAERGEARRALGVDASRPTIVGVSRLVPRKGFDVLIDAVALLPRSLDAQLVIVGDGRDRDRLEARARTLGVTGRVRFLGRVPDDVLPVAYRAADVFSMLCRTRWWGLEAEGFGIVFLEAAASGVPSVAGRSGGAPEAVHDGRTGVLVDPESPVEVRNAIELLLCDAGRRTTMGRDAREQAEKAWTYDERVRPLARLASGDFSVLAPFGAHDAR